MQPNDFDGENYIETKLISPLHVILDAIYESVEGRDGEDGGFNHVLPDEKSEEYDYFLHLEIVVTFMAYVDSQTKKARGRDGMYSKNSVS